MTKVSILINCYNGEEFLKQALNSITNQSFTDWEIIFVDNCSTDNSAMIAKEYQPKLKYYSTNSNVPLGEARNYGMQFCNSEYIAFLDVDDIWHEQKLQKQIDILDNNPQYAYCYTDYEIIDENNNHLSYYRTKHPNGHILSKMFRWYEVGMPTIMIRKSMLDKIIEPHFDTTIRYCPDYDLFMRLLINYEVCSIKEILAYYRIHSNNLTKKTTDIQYKETEYCINKFDRQYDLKSKYQEEYKHLYAWVDNLHAIYLLESKQVNEALPYLKNACYLGDKQKRRYELALLEDKQSRQKLFFEEFGIDIGM